MLLAKEIREGSRERRQALFAWLSKLKIQWAPGPARDHLYGKDSILPSTLFIRRRLLPSPLFVKTVRATGSRWYL